MKDVPNLLLIGAPRCASTALAAAIGKHPDIAVCEPKEPHFLAMWESGRTFSGTGAEAFGPDRVYGRERWKKLFSNRRERYLVDASVSTISFPDTSIPNIKNYCAPNSRIIATLRDPVERAFSSYMYCVSRGWDAGSFEQSLHDEERRIKNHWQHLWFLTYLSDYENRLQPFLNAFPRENIHIVIAEEFSANPDQVLNELFEFLELPITDIADSNARMNVSGHPRSQLFSEMLACVRNTPWLRETARKIASDKFRDSVKTSNVSKIDMNQETREMLEESLADTKCWVEQLVGRQLPSWSR